MSKPLPRYTQDRLIHDPVATLIAQRQATIDQAQAQIAAGINHADPVDRTRLRGIPCEGFGGTIKGTDPAWAATNHHRLGRNT